MEQIPLEDSGGPQLLKKLSVFYGIRGFITVFTTAQHFYPGPDKSSP
jgi:hypothetical protein